MLDKRLRIGTERALRPVGFRLRQAGFTADQITLLGLAASAFTGAAIASGHFGLAAAGLAVSGATDVLDGAVAKSGGTAGPRGAFFDSVADRLSDALVLGGVAWYLAGEAPHLSVLAFAVAALSFLVSYERSRAEALGLDGGGGLMERAERMVVLGAGLLFSALVAALWVLLVLTGITVVQRFVKVWRQASPARAAGDLRRGWWLVTRPAGPEESRLARWRIAARPPGERTSAERSRLTRWLLSPWPPRSEEGDEDQGPVRRARWWPDSRAPGARMRSQRRRLRGRTRP